MRPALTVLDMARACLRKKGYDGLVSPHGNCACLLSDLATCGQIGEACEAGHRTRCDCGDGHDFHIVSGKRPRGKQHETPPSPPRR